MKVIETTAPLSIETIKQHFEDNSVEFLIDYENSDLKGEQLLVYLGNVDLPCDVKINGDEQLIELLDAYLQSTTIVKIPALETATLGMLMARKGQVLDPAIRPKKSIATMFSSYLDEWESRLDSCLVFDMWTVVDGNGDRVFEDKILSLPHDDTDSMVGANFVSLLDHPLMMEYYQTVRTEPKYYSKYFNDYMFKGKNLYSYWVNPANMIAMITTYTAAGGDYFEFVKAIKVAAPYIENDVPMNQWPEEAKFMTYIDKWKQEQQNDTSV